jgi:hypothetical protein
MKQILASLLLCFFLMGHAQAGLFEYHMNGTLDSYVKNSQKDADTVEALAGVKNTKTSSYYTDDRQQETIFANDYYKGGYNYKKATTFYNRNGYYNNSDYEAMLRDELRRFREEQNFIDDRKDDIYRELRDLDDVDSRYARDLEKRLQKEFDYLEDREEELEEIIDDLSEDILETDKNSKIRFEYYYNEYGQRVYYEVSKNIENQYFYDTRYYSCSASRYRYDDCYYNSRYYDDVYYNRYLNKKWINEDLEPVKDGHIYIR